MTFNHLHDALGLDAASETSMKSINLSHPHHLFCSLIMIWAEELISILITCVGDQPAPRASPQIPHPHLPLILTGGHYGRI